MSTSPRKHRAPYQPVNTLSSVQKPRFKPKHVPHDDDVATDDSFHAEGNSISGLGESSSLFEENYLVESPQYVIHSFLRLSQKPRL